MSKKHFIALADHLRKAGHMPSRIATVLECYDHSLSQSDIDGIQDLLLRTIADELADFCASQNRNFDRDRWLDYINGKCGPTGGKR